jgi:copper chaperone
MIAFRIDDMSCGHCQAAITQAVKALDADAQVRVDLDTHRVEIDSRRANAEQLAAVIADAGYTPIPA